MTARITCRDCGSAWTYQRVRRWPEDLYLCRACDQSHLEDSWSYWHENGFALNVIKASRVTYDIYHGAIWRPSTRRLYASLRSRVSWVLFNRGQAEPFLLEDGVRLIGRTPREVMKAIMRVEAEFGRRKRGRLPSDPVRGAMPDAERKRRERQRKRQAA